MVTIGRHRREVAKFAHEQIQLFHSYELGVISENAHTARIRTRDHGTTASTIVPSTLTKWLLNPLIMNLLKVY